MWGLGFDGCFFACCMMVLECVLGIIGFYSGLKGYCRAFYGALQWLKGRGFDGSL